MKLYLASGNAHKAQEFQALAAMSPALGLEVASAKALGGMPPVIEDAGTFVGNARKKAQALVSKVAEGEWALSDDSGLCVDALGGEPGVESAYYAGPQGDSAANLAKLVSVMRGVSPRTARFKCILYLVGPGGVEASFEGACEGTLLEEPKGGGGFGYDPIFVPEGYDRTFSELPESAKNALSHRGRAWAQLVAWMAGRAERP